MWELLEHPKYPGHWHVEYVNEHGEIAVVVFSGLDAQANAEEYQRFKNGN